MSSRSSIQDAQTEFPSDSFVDRLHDLTVYLTERRVGGEAKNSFYVLDTELASAVQQFEDTANSRAADLRRTFALRSRRSPKRRPSIDDSETSRSVPLLMKLWSGPHKHFRFSTPSKRRKISISNPSTPSDDASLSSSPPYIHHLSPSPTASVSTAPPDREPPGVTVAMLRALTRDVKAKYGGSPLAKG